MTAAEIHDTGPPSMLGNDDVKVAGPWGGPRVPRCPRLPLALVYVSVKREVRWRTIERLENDYARLINRHKFQWFLAGASIWARSIREIFRNNKTLRRGFYALVCGSAGSATVHYSAQIKMGYEAAKKLMGLS